MTQVSLARADSSRVKERLERTLNKTCGAAITQPMAEGK